MKKVSTIVSVNKDNRITVYLEYQLSRFDKLFKKFDDSDFGEHVRILGGKKDDYNVELNGDSLFISCKLEQRDNTKEEPFNSYLEEEVFDLLAELLFKYKTIYTVLKWGLCIGIGALTTTILL